MTGATGGITRRRLIQAGALAGAGAALPLAAAACADDDSGDREVRNVVLIVLDSGRRRGASLGST